ncbi:unnamed protein product [Pleuronectes platessa]|uniref:Melan-A n=1 Tax=Pleuronectes platessa TaxID=8262 RepID=A0A9N7YXK2_PLEPL|nr:unnamed protein product [Pleuronectes platessa]
MPRGDFNIYFASSRGGFVRAEEAVGIALLVVILAALLILGCWYFKKRSGYRLIRIGITFHCDFLFVYLITLFISPLSPQLFTHPSLRCRAPDRGHQVSQVGQYSEAGPSADNKMALTDFGSLRPAVPNAPPAYEKISTGPMPPPYSP